MLPEAGPSPRVRTFQKICALSGHTTCAKQPLQNRCSISPPSSSTFQLHISGESREAAVARVTGKFRAADQDGNGTLSFDEFRTVANAIGLGVGPRDLQFAFSRFDTSGDGKIDLNECISILFPAQISVQEAVATQHMERKEATRTRGAKRLDEANTDVLKAIKKVAGVVYETEMSLRKQFKLWDRDGSQGLDVDEMTKALNEIGFSVTLEQAMILFDAFDLDGDATISCWELVRGLGSLDPEIRMTAETLERERGRREAEEAAANAKAAADRAAEDAARRAAELAAQREAEDARRAAIEAARLVQEKADADAAAANMKAKADRAAAAAAAELERLRLEMERADSEATLTALRKQQEAVARANAEAETNAALAAAAAKSQLNASSAGFLGKMFKKLKESRAKKTREKELKEMRDEADRLQDEADRKAAAEAALKASAPLRRFASPTFQTEARECGGYSFRDTDPKKAPKSDDAIIAEIKKRMKALRVQPEDALAQCTTHPAVAQVATSEAAKAEYTGYGVDGQTFACFAKQFFVGLYRDRGEQLLCNQRLKAGLAPDGGAGGKDDANVLPVLDFLELFEWDPARLNGGQAAPGGSAAMPRANSAAKLKANKVNALTEHEVKLIHDLRETLFERHSKMTAMFAALDRDGTKNVTIEEFLHAMERAGALNLNHGIKDVQGHDGMGRGQAEITEKEACNIVGFFDRTGDGVLDYAEFMAILQDSKHFG